MRDPMTHRLKQLHIEMKALKEKASSGAKLTESRADQNSSSSFQTTRKL